MASNVTPVILDLRTTLMPQMPQKKHVGCQIRMGATKVCNIFSEMYY